MACLGYAAIAIDGFNFYVHLIWLLIHMLLLPKYQKAFNAINADFVVSEKKSDYDFMSPRFVSIYFSHLSAYEADNIVFNFHFDSTRVQRIIIHQLRAHRMRSSQMNRRSHK